jgi:hypothetical protein
MSGQEWYVYIYATVNVAVATYMLTFSHVCYVSLIFFRTSLEQRLGVMQICSFLTKRKLDNCSRLFDRNVD